MSVPSSNRLAETTTRPVNRELERVRCALSSGEARKISEPGLRSSAVLLLLYCKDGEYTVLFNKRTHKVEFNKGEICFPGGGMDDGDAGFLETALRETHEEMGISPASVTVLGELDETTTRAGFVIRPFVATIPYPYEFRPSEDEVAEVLEVPVSSLLDTRNVEDADWAHSKVYSFGEHKIFGATARILEQFLDAVGDLGLAGEVETG